MFVLGQLFTGKKAMKEIVEASKKLEGTANPTAEQQRQFLTAVSNAFRPGQAITQSVEENVSDANSQLQSISENAGINKAIKNVASNANNQMQGLKSVNTNSNIGKIDITQPGVGAALGINPKDLAYIERRGTPKVDTGVTPQGIFTQ